MNKRIFWIIIIPALLVIAGYLFIRFSLQSSIKKEEKNTASADSDTTSLKQSSALDLRPLFIKKLQQLVTKSSAGLYSLSVGDMKLDVLNSNISLENVSILPDKEILALLIKEAQAPNDVFTISFKNLVIEGVNLDDAISSKTMDYKLIKLVNPVIEVRHKKRTPVKKSGEDFSQRFLKEMQKLSINKVVIEGAAVTHYNDDKKGKQTKLNDFALTMNGILIDSTTRDDKDRFLFSKDATLSFKNFSTTAGLYHLKIGSVTIKAPQKTVALQNFSFKPELSKEAFQKKFKTRKEVYSLSIPTLNCSGMNWWDLLNEERVEAEAITVSDLKLNVYLDRTPPPSSRMGNFPNQMLMKMPMKISVPRISIKNMEVVYTEFNPKSAKEGTVVLDQINMTMTGVTNIQEKMGANKKMIVSGAARFMRKVPLNAAFKMDMKAYKKGIFSASLSLGGFDGTLANSFGGPLGLVNVKEGTLQKVEIKVSGDEMKATYDVLVLYKDLKVVLLEKDSGKKALDKKDVTSFLANFIIKNDNPKGDKEPRREKGEFVRNPDAGFLNLVWKAGLVGILKTIGAPAKLASKTQ